MLTKMQPQPVTSVRDQFLSRITVPVPHAVLDYALGLQELERLLHTVDQGEGQIYERFLSALGVGCHCPPEDLARIPKTGPAVVVANHPFGLLEGPLLGSLLTAVRPDVKFLANSVLAGVRQLTSVVIPVDPFGNASVQGNGRGLREALRWLSGGGLLVVFPAGEVSSIQFPRPVVSDPQWHRQIIGIIRRTRAKVVPVYLPGGNSLAFHMAGVLHPMFRTALLPREFLNKKQRRFEVVVGRPIPPERYDDFANPDEAVDYLRRRTYLLGNRLVQPKPALFPRKPHAAVEPAGAVGALTAELEALEPGAVLAASGEYTAYLAGASQIPKILREIGRLRELTFRAEGEGTGGAIDLDRFDNHYKHLFLWNRERLEVAGAYRLAVTDEVLGRFGPAGLYSSTLFRIPEAWWKQVDPAIELGRSFVRSEYQRSYQPLLLLWKAIGAFVARHPRYTRLFGPVSISHHYSRAAKDLIVAYFLQRNGSRDCGIRPRKPFRAGVFGAREIQELARSLQSVEELAQIVSDVEPDQAGIPVLLRQYAGLGGEILAFNVDPGFSYALDGLILVDLNKTGRRMVERYLGKEGAARFYENNGGD
ncbi:MAG: lysophospholipid acyltransferase family protein [Bryobacteraceae bacterium]|nr:lysophospholipid acyltransferase family protein [Bryobacteraceae bacterium]